MYVKRKLGVRDLMPMVRIISKLRIADFKACFSKETLDRVIENNKADADTEEQDVKKNVEKKVEDIGFDVVMNAIDILLCNIPLIEEELYTFLASMCERSLEEFRGLPPSALIVTLREVYTSEEARDFFMEAVKLVKLGLSSGISSTEDTEILQNC